MQVDIFPFILVRTAGLPAYPLTVPWPDEPAERIREHVLAQQVHTAFDTALTALPDSPVRTAVYNARKRFFQKRQLPGPTFEQQIADHLHIPTLVILQQHLQRWKTFQAAKDQTYLHIEAALLQNWQTIQQAAQQPVFQHALLFASHALLDRLPRFCAQAPAHFTAKDRQTGLALLQYLQRGAYKTSPLSHFTTIAAWRWSDDPALRKDAPEASFLQIPKAVATPNVALLPALYETLLQEPAFYQSLQIGLNPCIPDSYSSINWQNQPIEWLYFDGEQESVQQLAYHASVDKVITICLQHGRQLSWTVLVNELRQSVDMEDQLLQDFLLELVALGLLEWRWPEHGLSPAWAGSLYNYLGHLSAAPLLTEAAALLQWLRTAARTLPFQPLSEAQVTQQQAVQEIQHYFERQGSVAPPIPPEQVFFEDVEYPAIVHVNVATITQLTAQLAACWQQSGPQILPPFRTDLHAFAVATLHENEPIGFLDFSKKFLAQKAQFEHAQNVEIEPFIGKIGALLQIFTNGQGQSGAVVNALFPGGGKLLVRWLHVLPAEVRTQLQTWFPADAHAYPWQGWSNANFQPPVARQAIAVPDGRVIPVSSGQIHTLSELVVRRNGNNVYLSEADTNQRVWLTDLGLEAPTERPPVMQILWHLGVPHVSVEALWPRTTAWQNLGEGVSFQERVTYQSLILRRARWRIAATTWHTWLRESAKTGERLAQLRQHLLKLGIPTHFFARFASAKPQYFDRDSPICLLLLEKTARSQTGELYLTEMLPLPEQSVVEQGGKRVAEFVVEFQG